MLIVDIINKLIKQSNNETYNLYLLFFHHSIYKNHYKNQRISLKNGKHYPKNGNN